MKLRYKLWIVFSLLWLVGVGTLQWFLVDIYKERALEGQQQLAYSQGMTIKNRLNGMLPRFPERAQGYLDYYSQTLSTRIILLDGDSLTLYDSFHQLESGRRLELAILNHSRPLPDSLFLHTDTYGHVQYTLLDLNNEAQDVRLLIVKDANGIYEDIRDFRWNIVLFLGGASLVGFLVCFGVATWFTRPIRQIVQHLELITPQNRKFDMEYRRKDELGHLVTQIGLMVQQLDRYEKKQRRFISASSHELKTPLATIQLITENLPHLVGNKPLLEEYIMDLQQQVDKMKLTVKSMLDAYRMTEHPLQPTLLSFRSIREHLEKTFLPLAEDRRMQLQFEASPDVHSLFADRSLLYSGLDNLMSNAMVYSPEGSTIRISLLPGHGDLTLLRICDEGIGIDPEDLPYIFEPFYRSSQAAAWNPEGSGFGLAMVKQMVDLHEGQIEVESTSHKGTCFTLSFRNNRASM